MPALWEARDQGWLISLRCERARIGLKSARPCSKLAQLLHLPSLVAVIGPDVEVEDLAKRLRCPGCGSERFSLKIVTPPASDAGKADAVPKRRKMQPATRTNTLGTTPEEWIVFKCMRDGCARWGQHRRAELIKEFGTEIQMPSLLLPFAASRGCGLAKGDLEGDWVKVGRACRISYDVAD